MKGFLFLWGLCSLTIGAFCGMIISCSIDSRNKILKPIIAILSTALIGLIFAGMFAAETKANEDVWNNGYCEECGGEWHLNSVTQSRRGSKTYYWSCIDCGNVIETSMKFK